MTDNIYLDANAGITLSKKIEWKKLSELTNPSNIVSKHGQFAMKVLDESEEIVLSRLTKRPSDWRLIWTSGATEGIMTALRNVMMSRPSPRLECAAPKFGGDRGKILVTLGHHPVIDEIRSKWRTMFFTELDIDLVDEKDALDAISKNYYSAMYITWVISLSGDIVDSNSLASAFRERFPEGTIIVDGTQAVGKMPLRVEDSGADVFIMSGHKFGALKGIGCTIASLRTISRWVPLIPGTQQNGLRGGTLNVHGAYSMAVALEDSLSNLEKNIATTSKCIKEIVKTIKSAKISGLRVISNGPSIGTVALLMIPICSKLVATELAELGYDVGIGTACQTDAPQTDKPLFLIRISLFPGETIDVKPFVDAFRKAYMKVLKM